MEIIGKVYTDDFDAQLSDCALKSLK